MAKSLRLNIEYIGTRKARVTVHGVPADITEDRMRAYFARYEQVEGVSTNISNAGIAIRDFVF